MYVSKYKNVEGWISREVLPVLRKEGRYLVPQGERGWLQSTLPDTWAVELDDDELRDGGLISESAMYKLTMSAPTAGARLFASWVAKELYPELCATGGYDLAKHGRAALPLPLDLAEAVYRLSTTPDEANALLKSVLSVRR